MLKRLLYILVILFSSTVLSQLSKTHYIPPITSGISNAIPNDQYIYISTPSDGLVNFSIKRADGVELQSGQVSNTDLILIQLLQMDIQNLFKMLQLQVK